MRFHSRAAIVAVTCLLAGALSQGLAQAAPGAHPAASVSPASPAAAGLMQTALRTAKATGKAVPVPSQTTATSTTTALPDGKFAMTTYVMPVRVRQHRAWVPISAALRRNADGTYSPAATPSGLALSGGGAGPFAVLTSPSGKRVSMTFGFRLPVPSVSDATAVYANVLPGVDLDVTATDQGGFDEVLVIKNAAAAADPALRQLRIATVANGLTVRTDAAGNMTASPPGGSPQFVA